MTYRQAVTQSVGRIPTHALVLFEDDDMYATVRRWNLHQLADEISPLKAKWRELEFALHSMQQKQKKSDQYYARKSRKDDSSSSVDLTHADNKGDKLSTPFLWLMPV